MEKTGAEFLNRLYKDMHMSDIVMHTASPSDTPAGKIEKYLERLERVHNKANHHSTDTGIRLLKKYYYDHYVIKPENISDKYWQFLDSQYFNQRGVHMTEAEKKQHLEIIIADQKSSLDSWIDYLSSDDAKFYPTWAKYWAFQGMLKIGGYDNKNGVYKRRDKSTVAPFVELNQEALSKVVDMMVKVVSQEKIEETFQQLVENGNFQKLYTLLLKQQREKVVLNSDTAGVWKKYNMGSDYYPLWQSLQGKNTGWCTAGESTCRSQLSAGDFYVYYTYDEKGEAVNPRLAIRMDGTNQIGEIRGIAKDQNIEPNFENIVEDKIKDFPDRKKYQKRLNDLKKLTAVYQKYQSKEVLTKEDVLFVYGNVEDCGWQPDPRLLELRENVINNAREELESDVEFIKQLLYQNGSTLQYVSEELRNNPEIVMVAIQQDGSVLQYASTELKNSAEFIKTIVKLNGSALQYASDELRNDPEIVKIAVQQNSYALQYASDELRNDPEIVKIAVQQNSYALQYASDELRNDPEIVKIAVQQNGYALQYASDELRNDPEIVKIAVQQNGVALQYASDELRNDPEIVKIAVQQNGNALQYANKNLKNNSQVVMAAVQQNGCSLQFASPNLQNDSKIVMAAVQQNGFALENASVELRNNLDIVKIAVQNFWESFCFVGEEFKKNTNNMLQIIQVNGNVLKYFSPELQNDFQIVMTAIKKNGSALEYASDELRNNPEIVITAVQQDGLALRHVSEELRNDPKIVMAAVQQDGYALCYASENLKNDKEFVMAAIQQDILAVNGIGDQLKDDAEFMKPLIHHNGYILACVSDKLRNNPDIVLTAMKSDIIKSVNELVSDITDAESVILKEGTPLRVVNISLRDNPQFMLKAIKECKYSIIDASDQLKHDKQFILSAIRVNPDVYLLEEWKQDPDVIKTVKDVKKNQEKSITQGISNSSLDAKASQIINDMTSGKIDTNGNSISSFDESFKKK